LKTTTFFRLSLLLPLFAPLAVYALGASGVAAGILTLSLLFGGIQYALFAVLLFFVVGRLRSAKRIIHLSLWTPVLFVPVQGMGWFLYGALTTSVEAGMSNNAEGLLPFAAYSLALGYVYVVVVNVTYYAFSSLSWVREESVE
jgi:hypothetical protein